MSTHVYVLQRLKALGDGENGADNFALDPIGKSAEAPTAPKCSDRLHQYLHRK